VREMSQKKCSLSKDNVEWDLVRVGSLLRVHLW
jgi:hypothetical protein